MTKEKPVHIVVIFHAAWGHVRPLLYLSLNLLAIHENLHLTLLLAPSVGPLITKEFNSSSFAMHNGLKSASDGNGDAVSIEDSTVITSRLQKLDVKTAGFKLPDVIEWSALQEEAMEMPKAVPSFITALFTGKEDVEGVPNKFASMVPSAIIFDLFQSYIPDLIPATLKTTHQPVVPLIAFFPANAVATYHHFALAEHGGKFDVMRVRVEESVARGEDLDEATQKHALAGYGDVKSLPGLPDMYDYQIHGLLGSQPLPPSAVLTMMINGLYTAARHPNTTAFLLPTPAEMEPEAVQALTQELGKPIHMAGIQFPEPIWKQEAPTPKKLSAEDTKAITFLDRMKVEHGEKSVVYVSFGSAFYPLLRPEIVTWLLESLHSNKIPFIFAYAADMVQTPQHLLDQFGSDNNCCIVKFAPQWEILDHPVTGVFVSHCGSNSVAEAIMTGTPLVCTPIVADQGEFAAMMVLRGVGIDLKQVKTFKIGNDRKFTKLYDGTEVIGTEDAIKNEMSEVWTTIRGAEGEQMRSRMQELRELCMKSWSEGKSYETMSGFSSYF